jgi:hypothetical protein
MSRVRAQGTPGSIAKKAIEINGDGAVLEILFLLVAAHFLFDLALQPETMAAAKDRNNPIHGRTGPGFPAWPYWLIGHAFCHGGAVFLVTNNVALGLAEVVLHALIDFTKCEKRISFHTDQILHLGCKVVYCLVMVFAAG